MKRICQGASPGALFQAFEHWCERGAEAQKCTISVMTAYITGGALERIEPLIDLFLSADNRMQIIFGVNVGGTDRAAVERLTELQRTYHEQISIWAWDATYGGSLFHPKFYLCEGTSELSAIIGSANLTLGGLERNHEALLCFDQLAKKSLDASELRAIWQTWAAPAHQFNACLRTLTPDVALELLQRLTDSSADSGFFGPFSRLQFQRCNLAPPGAWSFTPCHASAIP